MSFRDIKVYLKPGDAVIGLVWFVLFMGSFLAFRMGRPPGSRARIIAGERAVETVSLRVDAAGLIQGPLGATAYRVEKGFIWITQAPCPQKHCMHLGRIHRSGEVLICVPNRIVIQIEGKMEGAVDAVTM